MMETKVDGVLLVAAHDKGFTALLKPLPEDLRETTVRLIVTPGEPDIEERVLIALRELRARTPSQVVVVVNQLSYSDAGNCAAKILNALPKNRPNIHMVIVGGIHHPDIKHAEKNGARLASLGEYSKDGPMAALRPHSLR